MIITIETKIPTLNNCYSNNKYGRRFLTNTAKAFKQLIRTEVIVHLFNSRRLVDGVPPVGTSYSNFYSPQYKGKVYLRIKSYFMRKGRDRDNPVKLIQDALEGILYKKDSQVYSGGVEKEDDKKIVDCEKIELEFYEIK